LTLVVVQAWRLAMIRGNNDRIPPGDADAQNRLDTEPSVHWFREAKQLLWRSSSSDDNDVVINRTWPTMWQRWQLGWRRHAVRQTDGRDIIIAMYTSPHSHWITMIIISMFMLY